MKLNSNSRRKFIKQTAQVAGSALVLPTLSHTSCASPAQRRGLGVALVGLGNYSTTMLGPALKETQNCYLSGIVTGTPSKAEKWAKEYDLREKNIYNYDNYDDIANNPDIDIIYVVLPNSMHGEYTIRALEAGKHVIVEKPMSLDAAEAQRMIDVAKKNNRKLSVGYRMHYDPYFVEVKRLGQQEAFGPINYMEATLAYSFTPDVNSWKVRKSMGGGSLYNLGVYPIQSVRHTKGAEPTHITAVATKQRTEVFQEIDENFSWVMEFADGAVANCFSGPSAYSDRLWAGCRDGFIELSPATNYTGQAGKTSNGPLDFPQVFQQKLQIDDFARCVAEDDVSMVRGEDGLADMLIIDAIHESIRTQQRVKVKAV